MKSKEQLTPVFLLGAGRSGTKFLRDILGVSQDVSVVPYDVGYVWRYGNESVPHDELSPDLLTDSIKAYIKDTLPQLSKKGDKKDSVNILIEKSVPNTLRPAFIQAVYPDAKFIHLIRDGRAVTESAIRLWQAPPERGYLLKKLKYFPWRNYRYAFWYIGNIIKGKLGAGRGQQIWGPAYDGIHEDVKSLPLEVVCARQWKRCVEVPLGFFDENKSKNVLEVRYETLMQDSAVLESICSFIGITDIDAIKEEYHSKVVKTHAEKWKESLSAEQLKMINSEIEELNISLGYEALK